MLELAVCISSDFLVWQCGHSSLVGHWGYSGWVSLETLAKAEENENELSSGISSVLERIGSASFILSKTFWLFGSESCNLKEFRWFREIETSWVNISRTVLWGILLFSNINKHAMQERVHREVIWRNNPLSETNQTSLLPFFFQSFQDTSPWDGATHNQGGFSFPC